MADGIQITHPTARSQCCLIELRHRPYLLSYGSAGVCDGEGGRPLIPAPILDCSCGVIHEFKTVHVHVDDAGSAVVSAGVWDMILSAGECGFSVAGHTTAPPGVNVGVTRVENDYLERRYRPLTPMRKAV